MIGEHDQRQASSLSGSSQRDNLGLLNRVSDRDGAGIESYNLRCERDVQDATATRGQAGATIVSLGVVAFHLITSEVHGLRVWIVRVVK